TYGSSKHENSSRGNRRGGPLLGGFARGTRRRRLVQQARRQQGRIRHSRRGARVPKGSLRTAAPQRRQGRRQEAQQRRVSRRSEARRNSQAAAGRRSCVPRTSRRQGRGPP